MRVGDALLIPHWLVCSNATQDKMVNSSFYKTSWNSVHESLMDIGNMKFEISSFHLPEPFCLFSWCLCTSSLPIETLSTLIVGYTTVLFSLSEKMLFIFNQFTCLFVQDISSIIFRSCIGPCKLNNRLFGAAQFLL